MASDPLVSRLQRAISPDYRVESELARGGMGIVFRARDLTLDCPVAVKILRPELATAHAAEAFLREAHILARVRHPHIVTIHHAGEGEGLHYYITELVEGETLQERLERGPLPAGKALKLGRDLLDGLEAVHRAGIVHRDIKPSNVFVQGGRALLADFGIARPPSDATSRDGRPGVPLEGTPGYMAPEQLAGDPITVRTDIFAAGAVIYEAFTGRRLPPLAEDVSWEGVPWAVAQVLDRAVQVDASARWPDAASFRHALWHTRTRPYVGRTILLAAGGVIAGGVIALGVATWRVGTGSVPVAVPGFEFAGPEERRWIADSLVRLVRSELNGHPDFHVTSAGRDLPWARAAVLAQGRVVVADSEVRVVMVDRRAAPDAADATIDARAPLDRWPVLADSLTYAILVKLWETNSPLAASLPRSALPHSTRGLARFFEAERLVAAAHWQHAHRAYILAERTDSTCLLCSWRVNDVGRWLGLEPDPARTRRYLAHINSFPPTYASLIRAAQLPLAERLDTLQDVTRRSREFFLGWFQSGDELFHRGPLAGRLRGEAIPPLETAARLRPDFGPAWEHLAWVRIAQGDSSGAAFALHALDGRTSAADPYSRGLRLLLDLGYAWRFYPEASAIARTQGILEHPVARASPDFGAAPRLLPSFDAPRGAVAFGRLLAASPQHDLRRSGLIAEILGLVALGDLGARAVARELTDRAPGSEVELFAAELDAAWSIMDDAVDPPVDRGARLDQLARTGSEPTAVRQRATWMGTLLARRLGGATTPPASWPGGATVFHALLVADSLAAAGQPRRALALTHTLPIDSVALHLDPFVRAVSRLARARWFAEIGDIEAARHELRWHQHTHIAGVPTGLPQAAEIDWAFGTLARWRLARLLDGEGGGGKGGGGGGRGGPRGVVCRILGRVASLEERRPAVRSARRQRPPAGARSLVCPPGFMISCRTLGPLEVTVDGNAAPAELLWRKNVALLVYLTRAVTRRCTRDHAVGLLWPDKDETAARQSLREAVRVLRRSLGEEGLRTEGDQIELLDGAVELDTQRFDRFAEQHDWAGAARLVAGDFLEGFTVPDASPFEDWLVSERWHWRGRAIDVLVRHAEQRLGAGDLLGADGPARRAMQLDPISDRAARTLIRRLALAGDRSAALDLYARFSERVSKERSGVPDPETLALVDRLRRARAWRLPAEALAGERSIEWRRVPLIGRAREVAALMDWWHRARTGQGQLAVTILEAQSGGGKTRLVEEAMARVTLDGGLCISMRAVPADRDHPKSGVSALARGGGLAEAPGVAGAHPSALVALGRDLSEWAERFPFTRAAEEGQGWPLERAVAEVLRVVSAEVPLLLVFDDAHWLDADSLATIEMLARDLASAPIFILLATTPEPAPPQLAALRSRIGRDLRGTVLAVGPLEIAHIEGLVRWSFPSYSPEEISRLARRVAVDSAGVPLLAVEICHAVTQGLDLSATKGAWPSPLHTLDQTLPGDLPDSIVAAIRVGFRCLSRDGQAVVAAAAILGDRVTARTIGRAAQLEARRLHAALDELEWRRWLVAEPRGYAFVARIVKEIVARDMVTAGQRKRIREAASED